MHWKKPDPFCLNNFPTSIVADPDSHQIERWNPDPDSHQSDKLDPYPDLHQFADDKQCWRSRSASKWQAGSGSTSKWCGPQNFSEIYKVLFRKIIRWSLFQMTKCSFYMISSGIFFLTYHRRAGEEVKKSRDVSGVEHRTPIHIFSAKTPKFQTWAYRDDMLAYRC